jgi:hypothetical protein
MYNLIREGRCVSDTHFVIFHQIFENYTINIRNNKRLRNWIESVHYRSTGTSHEEREKRENDFVLFV